MPTWARSIRFRLALMYSAIVFGLAALLVAGVYIGVSKSIEGERMSAELVVAELTREGPVLTIEARRVTDTFYTLEGLVMKRTLDRLRDFSLLGLAGLFPVSVLIGWLVAGRVLQPIGRITRVANEIQATDLSRRIDLEGPDDELKQLADTFDGMLGRLEESSDAQRAFIHDTSHELRNPLAVMATNLDVVMGDVSASADDYRRVAGVVRRSIDRIAKTVEDLLTYARQGERSGPSDRVDPVSLVEEVAEEFRGPAAERQLEIVTRLEPLAPVDADATAVRAALQNLVGNAVRLAPIGTSIVIGAGERDGWVWLAVRDEGPGIPEPQQPLVWQRYWRGDGPGRPDPDRSGLGLAIVRQVAEAHGGTVQLFSQPGSGSTFVIWIPRTRSGDGNSPLGDSSPLESV